MKLKRLQNSPSALVDFFEEGLSSLGAVCERTWHDRLQIVAEGPGARLWDPHGSLLEKEIHFVAPDHVGPRLAETEVFPGCPLTFRLAEELRTKTLALERGVIQDVDSPKPPTPDVAEKLWHAQFPGSNRWKLEGTWRASWHFALLALARCETQAIDQHWALHRVALFLPDGSVDTALASSLDFLRLSASATDVVWPKADLEQWNVWLKAAFAIDLEPDLAEVRLRQQRFLQRELHRIDEYFHGYRKELADRERRAHAEGSKIKAQERLAAAQAEHVHRRQDQIRRHEIRVIIHPDAFLLLAEPAWESRLAFTLKNEAKAVSAQFVPRSRRWIITS